MGSTPRSMDFGNDGNFGNSGGCNRRIEVATTQMLNDPDYYLYDQSPMTRLGDNSVAPYGSRNKAYGPNGIPNVCASEPRDRDAGNYRQAFDAGRCHRQGLALDSRGYVSRGITNRKHCNASVEYRSKGSHNTFCNPCKVDDEVDHGGNQFGQPQLGWQSPCSTGDVRDPASPQHQLDQRCFTPYNYVLPAGARNPGVTPLARPYGLPVHWSLCRRELCTGADLRHTPPPDHLVQACEIFPGVYFGDDGGRRFPHDIHVCGDPNLHSGRLTRGD
ncbi:unnamed protein product [Calypogeia fissa]